MRNIAVYINRIRRHIYASSVINLAESHLQEPDYIEDDEYTIGYESYDAFNDEYDSLDISACSQVIPLTLVFFLFMFTSD